MSNRKVLVAIPCLSLGGTEYQTLNLVKALVQSGYSVTVLCYFEYDLVMVDYMKETGADVVLMTKDGNRPKKLTKLVTTLFTGFKKSLNLVKPDIVHVQYLAPGSLSILLFKFLGVKNIIATAHVPGHIYKRKWIPRLLANYITDSFLCVSKSSEESFFNEEPQLFSKQLMAEGRKHFTIYNCVEIDTKYSKQAHPVSENITIGVVSRLSYEKGIDVLIKAIPGILKTYPNARFLIVGDGKEKENLKSSAIKMKIENAITWAGLQPKDKLASYYAQMDIVAIPSRFEGFGLTAIEAMSYGIPVVASSVDGLKEVIENNKSGVLVNKEDPDALANIIKSLIKDKNKRNDFATSGKKRVEESFSYNNYKQQISDLYSVLTLTSH